MKRIFCILFLLFVFSVNPVNSQGQVIFLPVISKGDCMLDCSENSWKLIVPLESINKVLNPSAEKTGNYVALGTAIITRSTTYQHYGLYSYRVQTFADDDGIDLTLSQLSNSAHFLSFRVRGILPPNFRAIIGTGLKTPQLIQSINTYWSLYGVEFSPTECNGQTALHLIQQGLGSGDFYIDGIQVEAQTEWTTYIDGDQPGCSWNGTSHAASSTRSGESKAGGTVEDFYDTYGFFLKNVTGMGMTSRTLNIDEYALLPGGELNSIKIDFRNFAIIGEFRGQTEKIVHNNIQNFINAISPGHYYGNQPVIIRFSGAIVQKEISAYPKVGPEGEVNVYYGNLELVDSDKWGEIKEWVIPAAIQFTSTDPYWYEVGESAALLDTTDTDTFGYVAGRLRTTKQWDNLGPPVTAGAVFVYTVAEDSNYIYFGGDFDNFNGIANADNIVRYDKQTGTYSAMGVGLPGAGATVVWDIIIGPDGTIYAGGTQLDGINNGLVKWNGVAWVVVGALFNADVFDMEFDRSGNLYVVGNFTNIGVATCNRIAKWDGINWFNLGTGLDDEVGSIAIDPLDNIYVGGSFLNAGGVSAPYIAKWNGTNWSCPGVTGSNDRVICLAADRLGNIYASGLFSTIGGISASSIAMWNGTAWFPLGTGLQASAQHLEFGEDGILYASGSFLSAGGLTVSRGLSRWNGYTWSHIDFYTTGEVTHLLPSKYLDPVTKNYSLWMSFISSTIGQYGGKVIANNEGNVAAYPKIIFSMDGDAEATIETFRNERTNQQLLLNYIPIDDETLTINLSPTEKSVISSFYGSRLDAILPNSDFNDLSLLPSLNDITSFVRINTSLYGGTITAYMLWRDTYESFD